MPTVTPPEAALAHLRAGNLRFTSGRRRHPHLDPARLREAFEQGQQPFAAVLACSDSRVPVELLFDQGCADLFVIRVAGNVADTDEIGSVEFAVCHFDTPLVLVLGHTHCGVVTAVLQDATLEGCMPALLAEVQPAVARARARHPDGDAPTLIAAAVRENVWCAIEAILHRSAPVRARVATGRARLVGAVYDIATGRVDWLGPHPGEAALLAGDAAAG